MASSFRTAGCCRFLAFCMALQGAAGLAQTDARQVGAVLGEEILAPGVSLHQMKQYLLARVTPPPSPRSAEDWRAEAGRLRRHLLDEVLFHGWPRAWVDAAPRFEEAGVIESGKGYRIRKYRYEIVPGFWSAALLYEPEDLKPGSPAILNVNGHVGAPGKAVEYKQKRCIQFAKRGILALNLEWLACGELAQRDNSHWYGAHLDLVGANGTGLFYLAMRRGLDYLCAHPMADRRRIGMTGLSGGGWQTIMLSALDERVAAAVPVAGFSSIATRIEARRYGDLGDPEQSPSDFLAGADFTHLVGLRAPRPTLLVYNGEDDCCFRGPMVRPFVYEALRPLFRLMGGESALAWYENRDPGTHNYLKDNRLQAYRFFGRHLGVPGMEEEADLDAEILSYDELKVGLPDDNLSILGLARRLARDIPRPLPAGGGSRARLGQVVRYQPVRIARASCVANTKNRGLETKSYLFQMENGLSANGVWMRAIGRPDDCPATLLLNDGGKGASGAAASDRVNRGEQVLAADLLLVGDAWREIPAHQYVQILHGFGERGLGHVVSQLVALGRWMKERSGTPAVRLEAASVRSQTAALAAAALEPGLFSEVVVRSGAASLSHLLEKPVEFSEAPELFCLDLLKEFDLENLRRMR